MTLEERRLAYVKAIMTLSQTDRKAEVKQFLLDWADYVNQTDEENTVIWMLNMLENN
jgi:hypothetical protein